MEINELKLGDIKQLLSLFSPETKDTIVNHGGSKVKIAILQRGWVAVGKFKKEGEYCTLDNAAIIRKWGTSKGLGELAENGPLSGTVLDKCPQVKFHELTAVAIMDCKDSEWEKY